MESKSTIDAKIVYYNIKITVMKDLVDKLTDAMTSFYENATTNLRKGNKAAGVRARKTSLEIEKLLKEYRRASIEADKR